ncbi:MAG TPA: hypothetical protein VLH08_15405 [Acidobacteriota bacterium]|nr:hypothetical protein [Acidobacteriota bacterium]
MKLMLGILAVVLFLAVFAPTNATAQGAFYVEEVKEGRIYVFNDPKQYQIYKDSGELEVRITRIHAGPNGETMYFDSVNAIHMYNFKHGLPAEVIVSTEPAAPTWQEKLAYKFSGYMFGDYFYHVQRDPTITLLPNVALPGEEEFNAFNFRRIYFTYDDVISDDFVTRFRLEADSVALSSNGRISVFVKDAYLNWKNAVALNDIVIGIQPTPAYEVSEAAWAYRSLEKTIMDLRGIVSSRDIAVSWKGRIGTSGKYDYWIMAGNGSGNNPEIDKFKRLYFQFHWKPSEKFQASFYQDYRALPDIADPNDAARTINNSSYTTGWFAGYGVKDKYNIGYEGFITRQDNGNKFGSVAPFTVDDKKTFGHSFWAWYNFNQIVGVVGRYDYFEPNSDVGGDKRNLVIASLVLKPHKNIYFMPNLYYESYDDIAGASIDSSITPRITFYWIFL